MHLFGKPPTLDEYVRKWKRELTREQRNIERSIREISVGEKKTEHEIKKLAKQKDMASAKVLAKELVRSRKAKERLYKSKAQISGVSMQLTQQASMIKVQKTMAKSAQIMSAMNQLVRLPALSKTMMAMSREMEKAGLIEEMIDDVMEGDEELDEEADEQLDKVVDEILSGVVAAPVAADSLPAKEPAAAVSSAEPDEFDSMQARLDKLKA